MFLPCNHFFAQGPFDFSHGTGTWRRTLCKRWLAAVKYQSLRSSMYDSKPLLPLNLLSHYLLIKGGLISFDIGPRVALTKDDALLLVQHPSFAQLAQPLFHNLDGFVVHVEEAMKGWMWHAIQCEVLVKVMFFPNNGRVCENTCRHRSKYPSRVATLNSNIMTVKKPCNPGAWKLVQDSVGTFRGKTDQVLRLVDNGHFVIWAMSRRLAMKNEPVCILYDQKFANVCRLFWGQDSRF